MTRVPSSSSGLTQALRGREEILITATGRKDRRPITHPVWFVPERRTLWLLPVRGSRTRWLRHLRADPTIAVRAGRRRLTTTAEPVTDRATVRAVVAKFQRKYTRQEIERCYTTLDAAVRVPLP
jgi:deazaflavin-dependent oxidoreductase (nitroreductase family)